jgi:hypothetical protein
MAEEDQKTKKRKPSFVERVAERMGLHASAKAVYAEPVERDGVTIIPVAKVRWGFGGGSGSKSGKRGKGGGARRKRNSVLLGADHGKPAQILEAQTLATSQRRKIGPLNARDQFGHAAAREAA